MIARSVTFFLLVLCLGGCVDEKETLEDRTYAFITYVNAKNGTAAVNYLDQKTSQYFVKILRLVQEYNQDSIGYHFNTTKTQVLDNVLFIYAMKIPKYELAAFDERGLVTFGIDNQMIKPIDLSEWEVGEITLRDENSATVPLINKSNASPTIRLNWTKEDNEWKVNLTEFLPFSDAGMIQLIERSGLTREKFMNSLSETTTYMSNVIVIASAG